MDTVHGVTKSQAHLPVWAHTLRKTTNTLTCLRITQSLPNLGNHEQSCIHEQVFVWTSVSSQFFYWEDLKSDLWLQKAKAGGTRQRNLISEVPSHSQPPTPTPIPHFSSEELRVTDLSLSESPHVSPGHPILGFLFFKKPDFFVKSLNSWTFNCWQLIETQLKPNTMHLNAGHVSPV